jgi:hypothetical protein
MNMLTLFSRQRYAMCDGSSRRNFLKLGTLGLAGLTLADLLRLRASGAIAPKASHKAVINIYLAGGPSHIDMYDLKPNAPREIRGDFNPIHSNVPGMDICELMPLQAKIADKLAILRGVKFASDADHSSYQMMTGFLPFNPTVGWQSPTRPALGSVVSRLRGIKDGIPPYVSLELGTYGSHGEDPAYLGAAHKPFTPNARTINSLKLQKTVSSERLTDRKMLLQTFDGLRRDLDHPVSGLAGMEEFQAQALDIISSSKARDAFDVSREPEQVRTKYGKHTKFLQARRLVEAGVSVVTVDIDTASHKGCTGACWDTHTDNFPKLRTLIPTLDQALYALITDLHDRGLNNDVAVVVWGEFGRHPRVGDVSGTGRTHWAQAGFTLMACGGLRMGQVIGETNAWGERAKGKPHTPQHVLATLYHVLGIDPEMTLPDLTGRPQYLLDDREPIEELL